MTTRKSSEDGSEMAESEQVAVVVEPVAKVISPVVANPFSAQPAPHLKPEWDEPELDPMRRLSIAEDPDGLKNAKEMADAIARHQDKAAGA